MSIKRFLLAVAGVAMLAAVMASSASAASETGGEWHVEGFGTEANKHTLPEFLNKEKEEKKEYQKLGVECEIGEHNGEKKLVLTGEVGSVEPKTPVTLTATGVKCLESTIWNEGGSGKDTGKLEFTGVTVSTPPNCTVTGGVVKTNLLTTELYMDVANPTIAFDKFEPDAAAGVTNIANIPIAGAGCAVAGTKITKGWWFGQATNATGVQAVNQPLTFSPAIDTTAGSALEFAGNPVHLTGQAINFLSGANAGKKFWAE